MSVILPLIVSLPNDIPGTTLFEFLIAEDLDKTVEYIWKERAHRRVKVAGKSHSKGKGFINVTHSVRCL